MSSSSGASAVSRKPWKNSDAAISRVAARALDDERRVEREQRGRAGRTPDRRARPNRRSCRGGGPGCRRPAPATARTTPHSRASTSLVSRSRWRVSAPMATWSPASRTYERSRTRPTSTSTVGVASRSFISGSNDMPPARNFASSPCSAISAIGLVGRARRARSRTRRGSRGLRLHLSRPPASTDFTMLW